MLYIDAVIFDLDGVLVDACEWHFEALNRALMEMCGFEISRLEHESTFNGLPTKTKLNMLSETDLIPWDIHDKIWKRKQELTVDVIRDLTTVDEGKKELILAILGTGAKVGCVTNSIRASVDMMLDKTGIGDMFDFVIGSDEVDLPKPHPEGYITAMVSLRSLPKRTLIVEDSINGINAARMTGAHVLEVKNAEEVTIDLILPILKGEVKI